MISVPFELAQDENNPLDMIEEFATSRSWFTSRVTDTSILIKIAGQSGQYTIQLDWQDEFGALQFYCMPDIYIEDKYIPAAAELLMQINPSLWVGHFEITEKESSPVFRHTLMLNVVPAGIATEILAELVEVAVEECERFYPTFNLLSSGDIRTHDSLSAIMLKTVGEA